MRLWVTGMGAAAVALALAGCGSGSSGGGTTAAQGSPQQSSSASSSTDTVAGLTANDHGTKDVAGMSSLTIQAHNFYFDPSVLKGTAGQKLTLVIDNTTSTPHNFTLKAQSINSDLDAGKSVTTHVTFPASGVLSFYCEYHKGSGMAGGLLTSGDKAGSGGGSTSSSSSSGGGYGYGG